MRGKSTLLVPLELPVVDITQQRLGQEHDKHHDTNDRVGIVWRGGQLFEYSMSAWNLHLNRRLAPSLQREAGNLSLTYQTRAPSRWHQSQQHNAQGESGDVEQPGEDLHDIVDPHRPPARDEAQEDGPQRKQDHKGESRNDAVRGALADGRLVVEALPKPKAAVTIAVAAAAAVSRVAGAPTSRAAAAAAAAAASSSPAAKLCERWVGEHS